MLTSALSIREAFGERVRRLRKVRGISQEDFANCCPLDRSYMGQIERGECSPSIETCHLIARALGITLSQLLRGIESEFKH